MTYVIRIVLQTRRHTVYHPDFEDRVWYQALPLIAYVLITAGGSLLIAHNVVGAQVAFAVAAVTLVFVGIHNAWDLVTFLAVHGAEIAARTGATDDNE